MWFPSGPSAGEVRNGRFLLKVYRLLGSRWKGRESEISWDEDALCPQNRQEPSSLPAVPRRLLTDVQPFSRFSTLVYKKLLILYLKFTYSWALFHLAPYRRPPAVAGGGGWVQIWGKSHHRATRLRTSMGSCGQPEFSSWNSLQALNVHKPWSCLPALLIIHYLWLPSWLLMGSIWFGVGDSYLQSLDQDVHVVMKNMQIWCLSNRTGPEVGLLVLICATFNLTLLLGQCCCFLSSSGLWLTVARNNCQGKCGSWRKLCCSQLTRITASK